MDRVAFGHRREVREEGCPRGLPGTYCLLIRVDDPRECCSACAGPLPQASAAIALSLALAPGGDFAAGGGEQIGFQLTASSVHPRSALFAGKRKPTLRYRFRAAHAVDLKILVPRRAP